MRVKLEILGLTAMTLSACASTPAAPEPSRADICLARMEGMIEEAAAATGNVAGPSWFIRDWWEARRAEAGGERGDAWTVVRQTIDVRAMDEAARAAELQSCVDEAIAAGALP